MKIQIEGMNCQHCVKAVEQALNSVPGVSAVKVAIGSAEFSADAGVTVEKLRAVIDDAGFTLKE